MMIHPDIQAALFRERSAALLAAAAAYRRSRLSERSRRMRCPGRKTTLPEADLRYYTDVDHHDYEAREMVDVVSAERDSWSA